MRIIETKAYEFNELSEKAKERVIDKFRHDSEIYLDFFNEDCIEIAEEKGFMGIELQHSLSYCQGDGLSFSSKEYTKLEELYLKQLGKGKEKTAKLLAENTTFICTGSVGRYCFASSSDIDIYIENYTSSINTDLENINEVVKNVLQELENIYVDLCSKLEKRGYEDIEHQLSDEYIIESITCNEYEFTEEGNII